MTVVPTLTTLGLTELEAAVYEALVQASPATGYRIAQRVGKPTANVYKAISSLAAKGAVLVEKGRLRRCRAIPPADFIGTRVRTIAAAAERTIEELSRAVSVDADDGVYPLASAGQVAEKFDAMLEEARDVVLIDASPGPMQKRATALAQCARRRIAVAAKAYGPAEIPGVTVHIDPRSMVIRRRWKTEWLHAVVDGYETLLASMSPEGEVRYAIWTRNRYLSVVYHEALASEIILAGVASRIREGASAATLGRFLERELRVVRLDRRGFERLHAQEVR